MKHIEILNLSTENAELEDCSLYPIACGCCKRCLPLRPGVVMPYEM